MKSVLLSNDHGVSLFITFKLLKVLQQLDYETTVNFLKYQVSLLWLIFLLCNSVHASIAKSTETYESYKADNFGVKALKDFREKKVLVPATNPANESAAKTNLNAASLLFIENKGQVIDDAGNKHPEILFTAQSAGAKVYITANSIHYVFTNAKAPKPSKEGLKGMPGGMASDSPSHDEKVSIERMTVSLKGANPNAKLVVNQSESYYENYFLGHCTEGITAKSASKFTLKNVYEGVDWVMYSDGKGLKYDFVLKDPSLASMIQLDVLGASMKQTKTGGLELKGTIGTVNEQSPVSYQGKTKVQTAFKKLGSHTFGFQVTGAKPKQSLTIDPSVIWATYYGGAETDVAGTCAIDLYNNVLFTGTTSSSNFPVSVGAFQIVNAGAARSQDAFLVKISNTGGRIWATYVGGNDTDNGISCAVDPSGNIYMAGTTYSNNFPVSAGALRTNPELNRISDGFLCKFSNSGGRIWATYIGGEGDADDGWACAVDAFGNVVMTGTTFSSNFPITSSSAYQPVIGGTGDCFVVKLNSEGNLIWGTFYGGNGVDVGNSCTIDLSGNIFIAGRTGSPNFPVSLNAFQTGNSNGLDNAFLIKMDGSGTRLWATCIGGDAVDDARSVCVDSFGNVYVVGNTEASNFPVSSNAFQTIYNGNYSAFVVKMSGAGRLLWSTFYGGNELESANSCRVDYLGNLVVSGLTASTDFPIRPNAFQTTFGGGNYDGFIAKFNSSGNCIYSSYFGGALDDRSNSIAIDNLGGVYLSCYTLSNDLPITPGAFQSTNVGNYDAYIAKLDICTNDAPIVVASGDTTICARSSVTLTSSALRGNRWNTGDTTNSITVVASGVYSVRAILGGCSSVFSTPIKVVVTDPPSIPSISGGGPLSICPGESVNINVDPFTPQYKVSTLSGVRNSTALINGSISVARFNQPLGIAANSDGSILVCDLNHVIRKIQNGVVTTLAGNGADVSLDGSLTTSSFRTPIDVSRMVNGVFYVVDYDGSTVKKVDVNANTVTRFAGDGTRGYLNSTDARTGKLNRPTGVAVDSRGNMFIADATNHCIRKVDVNGVMTTFAGTNSSGFVNGNGSNARFNNPTGIAIDSIDNLYVADQNNNRIRKITSSGDVSTFAGTGAVSASNGNRLIATFNRPNVLRFDKYGNLFITDNSNNLIRRIDRLGIVSTVAGTTVGNRDGFASVAQFDTPNGIDIDSDGNIYIGDRGNDAVRKISYVDRPNYLWNTGDTGRAISVSSPGTYTAQAIAGGCTTAVSNTITISQTTTINPPTITSGGGPLVFCRGGSVTLISSANSNNIWSTGATTRTITVTTSGTYSVRTFNALCTSAASAAFDVRVVDTTAPVISVTRNTLCNAENAYVLRVDAVPSPSSECLSGFKLTNQTDRFGLGYAWYRTQINLRNSFQLQFNANFGALDVSGADGIMCIFQNDPRGQSAEGQRGGSLGLQGVTPSIGIEFDTYDNGAGDGDIPADHITFDANGNTSIPLVPPRPALANAGNIEDNRYHNIKVLWNASTTTMEVYFDGVFRTSLTRDIVSAFFRNNPVVYWGFGATTGGLQNNQSICGAFFFYDNNLDGQPDQLDDFPVVSVQNPDTNTTYIWNDYYRDTTVFASSLGNYSVYAVNGTCTTRRSNVVNISSITPATPVITASGPLTLCAGNTITLTSSAVGNNVWSNGENTQSITVRNSGTYTVRQIDRACTSFASVATVVTVLPALGVPVITLSRAPTMCAGDTILLTSPSATRNLWSNGDTNRTIKVFASGNYSLRVGNGVCYSLPSDTVRVVVFPIPERPTFTFSQSPDNLCEGDILVITSEFPDGNLWSNGATTQSIAVITTGNYFLRRIVNSCTSSAGSPIEIIVLPRPTTPLITALRPAVFCDGDSTILQGPSGFRYLWSTGDTTRQIVLKQTATITLRVIDANGCNSLPSVVTQVINNPLPVTPIILASRPLRFCDGDSVVLSAPLAVVGTFLWSNGQIGRSITVRDSLTVTLRVVNANGCTSAVSAPVSVVVYPLPARPTISALGSTSYCENDSLELRAPVSAGYLWSTGSTASSIVVRGNQRITLSVLSVEGCTSAISEAVQTVSFRNPRPVINGITSICPGLTGVVYKLQPDTMQFVTKQWFIDGGSIVGASTNVDSIVVNWGVVRRNDAKVKVVVTNTHGCQSDTSRLIARINTKLQPVIPTGDTLLCSNDVVRTYSIITYPSSIYTWQVLGGTVLAGAGTGQLQVQWDANPAVVHSIRYQENVSTTDTLCEGTSKALIVRISPRPDTALRVIGQKVFCGSQSGVRLRLAGFARSRYVWRFANGVLVTSGSSRDSSLAVSVALPGVYPFTVIETNVDGCVGALIYDTLRINEIPVARAGLGKTVCQESYISLGTDSIAGLAYRWRPGILVEDSTAARPRFLGRGIGTVKLYLTVSNKLSGCNSSDSGLITTYPKPPKPIITVTGDTIFCEGDSVLLSIPLSRINSILWSNGETKGTIRVTSSGKFSVRYTSLVGGCIGDVSDTVKVTVNPVPERPVITAITDSIMCIEGIFSLQAPLSAHYKWSTGDTTRNITVPTPRSVNLQVKNQFGCESELSAVMNLKYRELAVPDLSKNNIWLCPGKFDGLVYDVVGQAGSSFNWKVEGGSLLSSTGNQVEVNWNPSYNITRSISVAETTQYGCTSAEVKIIIYYDSLITKPESGCKLSDYEAGIPNVIITNSSIPINRVLYVSNLFLYPNAQLQVFNRWGGLVYKADNYNNDWGGDGLESGMYYYTFDTKRGATIKGWVMLQKD